MEHSLPGRLTAIFIVFVLCCATLCACKTENQAATPSAWTTASTQTPDIAGNNLCSVLFINVGKADAALLRIDGFSYLIDTGSSESVPALYGALQRCGVKKLDAVFLTHTHSDHIGGMKFLAQQFEIGTLYSAEISMDEKDGENKIDKLASELSTEHVKLRFGDKIEASAGVAFEVLGPISYNSDDDNDNSLVLRLCINGKTFLFTGDMQFAEEATLLAKNIALAADVIKVGNHGNPDATSEQFAKAVSPQYAVISTDTSVDANSANARVEKAFSGANILITENYDCGILFNVAADGQIGIFDPKPPEEPKQISIASIDKALQTVTIVNTGAEADISGYLLFSQRGSEVFVFPKGTKIAAKGTLQIACIGGAGDLIWSEKNVWSAKKEDAGVLYDAYGRELSRVP